MRAARYHGTRDIRLDDVEEPEPGPGEVKLRVAYNGLCGTDLHEYFDGQRAIPSQPHPLTGVQAPVILGHEITGHVVGVGAGVTGLGDGQLVVVEPIVRCGACPQCSSGAYNLCDRQAFHGLSTTGGGLAEHTVVTREMIHAVPDGMTTMAAALVEPLAVALHAVRRSGVQSGQTAVVLGAGPIGIGIFLTLRAAGVETMVIEPEPSRRTAIEALGAATVDPAVGDPGDQIAARTGGRGADVTFDAAVASTSFATAATTTAKGGVLVMLGTPRNPAAPVFGPLLSREITVRTTYAYRGEFPAVIEAVAAGTYPFDGWVETRPMSGLVAALDELHGGRGVKFLIDPSQ